MTDKRFARHASIMLEELLRGKTNFVQQDFIDLKPTYEQLDKLQRTAATLAFECRRAMELKR